MSKIKRISYSEVKHKGKFDWYEFLDPKKNGKRTNREWIKARGKAGMWTTCACGTQCNIIPRDTLGAPKDDQLRWLGRQFMNEIDDADPAAARVTLNKIEQRSALLLKPILYKLAAAKAVETRRRNQLLAKKLAVTTEAKLAAVARKHFRKAKSFVGVDPITAKRALDFVKKNK